MESKIYKTFEYEKFKYIEGNRPVNKHLVKALIHSFKHEFLLEKVPILVNDLFQVIDGQHRLEACKILKYPVFYRIEKDFDLDKIRAINTASAKWSLADYLESYVTLNVDSYILFKKVSDSTGLTVSNLLKLHAGRDLTYTTTLNPKKEVGTNDVKSFKLGMFRFSEVDALKLSITAKHYESFIKKIGFSNSKCMSCWLLIYNRNKNSNGDTISYEQFLKKLDQTEFKPQLNITDYYREAERVYNYNNKKWVSLF